MQVDSRLIRQLCQHLGFLPANHTAAVKLLGQFVQIISITVAQHKMSSASEFIEPVHYGKLGYQVSGMIHNRSAGQQDDVFLPGRYAFREYRLLCSWILHPMTLVDDNRLEHRYLRAEDHILQPERPAVALYIQDEILSKAFIIHNRYLMGHPQEVRPCRLGPVIQYQRLLVGELLELALPVYLQR